MENLLKTIGRNIPANAVPNLFLRFSWLCLVLALVFLLAAFSFSTILFPALSVAFWFLSLACHLSHRMLRRGS